MKKLIVLCSIAFFHLAVYAAIDVKGVRTGTDVELDPNTGKATKITIHCDGNLASVCFRIENNEDTHSDFIDDGVDYFGDLEILGETHSGGAHIYDVDQL